MTGLWLLLGYGVLLGVTLTVIAIQLADAVRDRKGRNRND